MGQSSTGHPDSCARAAFTVAATRAAGLPARAGGVLEDGYLAVKAPLHRSVRDLDVFSFLLFNKRSFCVFASEKRPDFSWDEFSARTGSVPIAVAPDQSATLEPLLLGPAGKKCAECSLYNWPWRVPSR